MPRSNSAATLLCVANYPTNTGYAWDFIEGLYAGVACELMRDGVRTLVAYPEIAQPPRILADGPAEAVQLDATCRTSQSIRDTLDVIRRERVTALYLTDRPSRSLAYLRLRAAGVRWIVVHTHASGDRSRPNGLRRTAKWLLGRMPWTVADVVITVSDFVARRQSEINLIPQRRIVRIWNGVSLPPENASHLKSTHHLLGLDPNRVLFVCACRANRVKGVVQLLHAFDHLVATWPHDRLRPALAYVGDGPLLPEIKALREQLAARDDITLTGYRSDAREVLAGADICVVPSVWQDALPLAVMEPMALAKPVIATAVGGIPEMIEDGVSGALVAPGDVPHLAQAMRRVADDPVLAQRLGSEARRRVAERFSRERQISALAEVVRRGL